MLSSTRSMPVCCAHATPAIGISPATRSRNGDGVSILDIVLIGARSAQPRCTQYGSYASNVVSSMSTSHFIADT